MSYNYCWCWCKKIFSMTTTAAILKHVQQKKKIKKENILDFYY